MTPIQAITQARDLLDLADKDGHYALAIYSLKEAVKDINLLEKQLAESQARVRELEKQLKSCLANKWKAKCLESQAREAKLREALCDAWESNGYRVTRPPTMHVPIVEKE